MFDVGFSELVLLFIIGLLILGPERLPRVASQIGRWIGRARRTANQLRHQLEREIALDDIRRPPKPPPPKKPGQAEPPAWEANIDTGSESDQSTKADPPTSDANADTSSEDDQSTNTDSHESAAEDPPNKSPSG